MIPLQERLHLFMQLLLISAFRRQLINQVFLILLAIIINKSVAVELLIYFFEIIRYSLLLLER